MNQASIHREVAVVEQHRARDPVAQQIERQLVLGIRGALVARGEERKTHAPGLLAQQADVTFAQFVMLTPLPGTLDFERWEKDSADTVEKVDGIPLTRYWLIPSGKRPKIYTPHPTMSPAEIRTGTQAAWDHFYSLGAIWKRSNAVKSLKARLAFVLLSKLYRQMYANTGIATDSARVQRSAKRARLLAKLARRLFISPKTAAVHVSNILTKLDMSSRAEIAAWAVRTGIADDFLGRAV